MSFSPDLLHDELLAASKRLSVYGGNLCELTLNRENFNLMKSYLTKTVSSYHTRVVKDAFYIATQQGRIKLTSEE